MKAIIHTALFAAVGVLLATGTAAGQDVYARPDVREAVKRIEKHGDRFKHAYKEALEHASVSPAEKRVRDLAQDLEDEVDNLQRNFKDGHYQQARVNLDNAMLMAASVDRFMQRNYFGPEARRAWADLRSDLNVVASAYSVPPLPVLAWNEYGAANRADRGFIPDRSRTWLERQVRHELVMLPYYGVFDNLQYRIDGDTVTLFGQVTRPTLKSSAEQVVREIEGVDRVINEIQVLPASPNDDRIRAELYRAIYSQPALNRYALQAVPPIHIVVNNGQVTLDGVVANEGDRNIAAIQAQSVPGVFTVTNNLRVVPSGS